MVYTAEEAAKQLDSDGVSVEIVDLRTVMPWDKEAVLASVRKTSKVVVLHEDNAHRRLRRRDRRNDRRGGVRGSRRTRRSGSLRRICPVPFSPVLEKAFIPQVEDVVQGLRELAEY